VEKIDEVMVPGSFFEAVTEHFLHEAGELFGIAKTKVGNFLRLLNLSYQF
jgi:hypothetical protein